MFRLFRSYKEAHLSNGYVSVPHIPLRFFTIFLAVYIIFFIMGLLITLYTASDSLKGIIYTASDFLKELNKALTSILPLMAFIVSFCAIWDRIRKK